ncbi:MAG: LysR family transcriptional regulator [Thermoprotei archaeon]
MGQANRDLQPAFRLWLEGKTNQVVFDQVDAMLLRRINENGSLSAAAKIVGLSYRAAWGRIKRLENVLGRPLVVKRVGGKGGGGSRLTEDGLNLLTQFRKLRKHLFNALEDQDFWAQVGYKLSARNILPAKITAVEKGSIVSKLTLEVEAPIRLISIITNEAVESLNLHIGDDVYAVVKSTDIIVAKKLTSV